MNLRICRKQSSDGPVPNFTLDSIDGCKVSLWEYHNRHNVVILFFDPSSSNDLSTLRLFGLKDLEFADANTEILAVAKDPDEYSIQRMKAMSIPFHILADHGSSTRDRLMIEHVPCVAVLDSSGILLMMCSECCNVNAVLEDIISELQTVEMLSPNCGASSWRMDY